MAAVLEEGAIITKKGVIVHIPNIFRDVQGFFDVVIEPVEIDIGKKLTGEVTDGDSFGAL